MIFLNFELPSKLVLTVENWDWRATIVDSRSTKQLLCCDLGSIVYAMNTFWIFVLILPVLVLKNVKFRSLFIFSGSRNPVPSPIIAPIWLQAYWKSTVSLCLIFSWKLAQTLVLKANLCAWAMLSMVRSVFTWAYFQSKNRKFYPFLILRKISYNAGNRSFTIRSHFTSKVHRKIKISLLHRSLTVLG